MTDKTHFLFEIGLEELPSKAVLRLSNAFLLAMKQKLSSENITYSSMAIYATPRRIAILIKEMSTRLPEKRIEKRGPSLDKAFNENKQPTKALQGFLAGLQLTLSDITEKSVDGNQYVFATKVEPSQSIALLLADWIHVILQGLPIEKLMRWGNEITGFVRPVHWVVMMLGEAVIEATFFGVLSSNTTYGHRYHANHAISIQDPLTYESLLADAKVIASFDKRKAMINEAIALIEKNQQLKAVFDDDLLNEVTSIVEYPSPLLVSFDTRFLAIPKEVLIASIHQHQKCFPLMNEHGELTNYFIAISNIDSINPNAVMQGNEKVMSARLSDALFFFEQDRNIPLMSYLEKSKTLVFQVKLGTLFEKIERMKALALGLIDHFSVTKDIVIHAIDLSKMDLLTGMVQEFPELQGVMGYHYALLQGESMTIAQSMYEQYLPNFSGDSLPTSQLGTIISIVDRLDTLVGIIGIGLKPTGEKDPFKLRRHALALIRMMLNHPKDISFRKLVEETATVLASKITMNALTLDTILTFTADRLKHYFLQEGYSHDKIDAVLAVHGDNFKQSKHILDNLVALENNQDYLDCLKAIKRMTNLLSSKQANNYQGESIDTALFNTQEEAMLYTQYQTEQALKADTQNDNVSSLFSLTAPLNAFFDNVMVFSDDMSLMINRLALLNAIQVLSLKYCDFSRLGG